MSVKVRDITKIYGTQKAVDRVSFEIEKGEIVGLLGPNGAGKSTIMKILTCFIPPSSGEAGIYGFDVQEQSIEVRKKVGYLPENNPLYYEMYVREYLEFVAGIHQIENKRKRIADIIEQVGLSIESHKKIGMLSKGYKQRVGLAQALIHDPEVLILDEPTSGLDPNQLLEIRNLIKETGKEKTVILSTHIMQEVEAICDRVIILNKGAVVADDKTAQLTRQKGITLIVEFDKNPSRSQLTKIPHVQQVKQLEGDVWLLESQAGKDIRQELLRWALQHELTIQSLRQEAKSMEETFRALTKN